MLTVKTVSIVRVTRYIAESAGGLVSADVSIALIDEELGIAPIVDINVDLPHVEHLSLREIEQRALEAALSTLTFAASLNAGELIKTYRSKFDEPTDAAESLLN